MPFPPFPRRAGLAAAGAVLALALSGCGADKAPKAAAVPVVSALTVERTSVPLALELPGRTAPFLLAEVRARVDGIVQDRRFVEGADVRKGDPLYLIDPAPYRAALSSAQATLQRARANLAGTSSQLDRYKVLVGGNAVSTQAYDNAEAALATARINLGYTSVTAPIAGRSSVSQVTQGAYVQGGSATLMTTIQQLDPMYVDLQQSSAEGLALRRGIASGALKLEDAGKAQVRLKLEDGSTYEHAGILEYSGVTVDRDTGSVTLRARFPNPDKLLLPGMFVRASVEQGVRQGVVRVPAPAVTRNPQGEATVMLVGAGNRTEVRTVETSSLVDGHWLVEHGLKEGERVIVSGVQKLRPGVVVTPRAVAAGKLAQAPASTPAAAR
jgi:membrane fusion protein (multidrug efflux system)